MNAPHKIGQSSAAPSSGMVPFNWEDPFDLESQLTEDERMIRDTRRMALHRASCSRV